MQAPSVGRIVVYEDPALLPTDQTRFASKVRAVHTNTRVDLTVYPGDGTSIPISDIEHQSVAQGGVYWFWPARA
jgi:hypothetical protein